MPRKVYRRTCQCTGVTLVSRARCDTCGAAWEFAGWGPSMIEGWGQYVRAYGLPPIGPHGKLARELLSTQRTRCPTCAGLGWISGKQDTPRDCPTCHATGGLWTCSREEMERLRERVLQAHPEIKAPPPPAHFPTVADVEKEVDLTEAEPIDYETAGWRREEIVYARFTESLIFLHRELADDLAILREALGSATTWGEFRERVPMRRYIEVLMLLPEDDRERPAPADETLFPGYGFARIAEGDYPEWPSQLMLDWMPEEIRHAPYSHYRDSIHNGEFLVIEPTAEPEVVAHLRQSGYEVTKDVELVQRALDRTAVGDG